jgi:hypothetical protein
MELKFAVSPLISKVRKTIDKYYVLMNGNNIQSYCRVKTNVKTRNLGLEGGVWGQLRLLSTVKVDLKKTAYFNFIY